MHFLDAGLFPCPCTLQLWCLLTGPARRARRSCQKTEKAQSVRAAGEGSPVRASETSEERSRGRSVFC